MRAVKEAELAVWLSLCQPEDMASNSCTVSATFSNPTSSDNSGSSNLASPYSFSAWAGGVLSEVEELDEELEPLEDEMQVT